MNEKIDLVVPDKVEFSYDNDRVEYKEVLHPVGDQTPKELLETTRKFVDPLASMIQMEPDYTIEGDAVHVEIRSEADPGTALGLVIGELFVLEKHVNPGGLEQLLKVGEGMLETTTVRD